MWLLSFTEHFPKPLREKFPSIEKSKSSPYFKCKIHQAPPQFPHSLGLFNSSLINFPLFKGFLTSRKGAGRLWAEESLQVFPAGGRQAGRSSRCALLAWPSLWKLEFAPIFGAASKQILFVTSSEHHNNKNEQMDKENMELKWEHPVNSICLTSVKK